MSSGMAPINTVCKISSADGGCLGPSGSGIIIGLGTGTTGAAEDCGVEIVVAPESVWPK